MHYYQFNIADYRKDTQHLNPLEHYIYRELMDWCYLDERPIPKETQWITRRLRLGSDSDTMINDVLNEFFTETEKGWVHKRILKEIEKYKSFLDKQRVNGSKGGRPKKPKPNPSLTQTKPKKTLTTNHKPLTNNQKSNGRFAPPSLIEVENYISEKSYQINPVAFVSHYEANGWMVGKNKMKDWKAAVRGWEARDGGDKKQSVFSGAMI